MARSPETGELAYADAGAIYHRRPGVPTQPVTTGVENLCMCMMCDGASLDEVAFHIHGMIERHGWAIVPVGGDATTVTDWAYTIGLVAGFGPPYPEPSAVQVVLPDGRHCHEHQQSQPLLDTAADVLSMHPPNRAARRAHQRRRLRRIK